MMKQIMALATVFLLVNLTYSQSDTTKNPNYTADDYDFWNDFDLNNLDVEFYSSVQLLANNAIGQELSGNYYIAGQVFTRDTVAMSTPSRKRKDYGDVTKYYGINWELNTKGTYITNVYEKPDLIKLYMGVACTWSIDFMGDGDTKTGQGNSIMLFFLKKDKKVLLNLLKKYSIKLSKK